MWSADSGSEIMQRIALPMIGGMISSTLLTLIVIPAIFGLVKGGSRETSQPAEALAAGTSGSQTRIKFPIRNE
jgi:Cu(I)/Ag(I) efflux system membrane protein CusA/SilA